MLKMRYELTKDLETGNSMIDKEHRELLEAVNKLLDACSKGQGRTSVDSTVKFLNNYVNRHFTHEEQLQQSSNYPGYAGHKAFHESYKKQLKDILAKIPAAGASIADLSAVNGHIGILVTHIRTEDKKLGQFLQKS